MKSVFLYVVYKWKNEILSFFVTLNIVRNLYTFTHVHRFFTWFRMVICQEDGSLRYTTSFKGVQYTSPSL